MDEMERFKWVGDYAIVALVTSLLLMAASVFIFTVAEVLG